MTMTEPGTASVPDTGAQTGRPAGREPAAPEYDTYIVAVPDLAGRLVGKRIDGAFYTRSAAQGVRTCDVVFGWGIGHELLDGFDDVGWEHGYGDFIAVPDAGTLRPAAWWPRTALVIADAVRDDGQAVAVAPRSILNEQLARASALGLEPVVASELEFTVFDETIDSLDDKGYAQLVPHGRQLHPELVESTGHDEDFLGPLRRDLVNSRIPVESIKAEYSRGQFELVMSAAGAMEAADNHAVYKLAVREICRRAGLSASFMAKWHESFGGSSCHLHISFLDDDLQNVFAADDRLLHHFIGGLQRYAADVFLLWAPYPNSYKRFRPGSFAPASLSWGSDNRTAALRVTGDGKSRHLENRIPGADVNPYLAYAGLLAAGLAGIEEKIDPDSGVGTSNAYARDGERQLPKNVDEAVDAFSFSAFARGCFGDAVVDHIANFAAKEIDASRLAVTDWDRRRLFDI